MSNLESGILESILFKWAILEFSAYWQPTDKFFLEKLWTIEKVCSPKTNEFVIAGALLPMK